MEDAPQVADLCTQLGYHCHKTQKSFRKEL